MWLATALLTSALAGSSDVDSGAANPTETLPHALMAYSSPSVAMDPAGTLHLIGRRKVSGKGMLQSLMYSSSDPNAEPSNLIYLQQTPEGTWSEETVPGPPSLDGQWGGSEFLDASIDVDSTGRVFILMIEDFPDADGKGSSTLVYLSVRDTSGAWTTRQLPSWVGQYEAALGVHQDKWMVAGLWTGEGKPRIVRWEEGRSEEVLWDETDLLAGALTWVDGAPEPTVLYRKLGKLFQLNADGTTESLGDGGARKMSAVHAGGETQVFLYKASKDSPYVKHGEQLDRLDTKEAGWHSDLELTPDGTPVAAWYYRRNAFNKGLAIGVPDASGTWQRRVLLRDEQTNRGWNPTIAVGDGGQVAVALLNRSDKRLEVQRYASIEALNQATVEPATDWTRNHSSISALAYGGAWYQFWAGETTAPDPREDIYEAGVRPLDGDLDTDPGLGAEGGFALRLGRVDMALEYLQRSDSDAAGALQKINNIAGKVSMDKFPLPGSTAQLHFRSADLDAQWAAPGGKVEEFRLSDRMVQLRYVSKGNGYVGASYRSFAAPQDLYSLRPGPEEVEDAPDTILSSWETDGDFKITSLVGGWSVMNYLGRYEVSHLGPYCDGQVGAGYAAGTFTADDGSVTNQGGAALSAQLDVGVVGYKRFRSLRGAGLFTQVGARGDGQMIFSRSGDDDLKIRYGRVDRRYGPYANVGLVF